MMLTSFFRKKLQPTSPLESIESIQEHANESAMSPEKLKRKNEFLDMSHESAEYFSYLRNNEESEFYKDLYRQGDKVS